MRTIEEVVDEIRNHEGYNLHEALNEIKAIHKVELSIWGNGLDGVSDEELKGAISDMQIIKHILLKYYGKELGEDRAKFERMFDIAIKAMVKVWIGEE